VAFILWPPCHRTLHLALGMLCQRRSSFASWPAPRPQDFVHGAAGPDSFLVGCPLYTHGHFTQSPSADPSPKRQFQFHFQIRIPFPSETPACLLCPALVGFTLQPGSRRYKLVVENLFEKPLPLLNGLYMH